MSSNIVFGYFGSWSYDNKDELYEKKFKFDIREDDAKLCAQLCTHIAYAFCVLDENHEMKDHNSHLEAMNYVRFAVKDLKKVNPQLKFLVSVGGYNAGSEKFSRMASNPESRGIFIASVVKFLTEKHLDGLDLSWHYPTQRGGIKDDRKNFVQLLSELKQKFNEHGFILTIAAIAAPDQSDMSYDIEDVSKHVDFINLMTYDFSIAFARGHGAPINQIEESIEHWIDRDAPPGKLLLGIPFYGRKYKLGRVEGSSSIDETSQKELAYFQVQNELLGEDCQKGDDECAPTAELENSEFMYYEDVISVRKKAELVKKFKLGGVNVWALDQDDFRGAFGEKYPLLNAVVKELSA